MLECEDDGELRKNTGESSQMHVFTSLRTDVRNEHSMNTSSRSVLLPLTTERQCGSGDTCPR